MSCARKESPSKAFAGVVNRRRAVIGGFVAGSLVALPRDARAEGSTIVDANALDKPWSATEFTMPTEGGAIPSILIRLPEGGWYASSRICPHALCLVIYVDDVQMARDTFNVQVSHPILGCPCHFSVFDITQAGKVLSGPAPQPLPQFKVRQESSSVYIDR
jgi:Rieske Fe-S protein